MSAGDVVLLAGVLGSLTTMGALMVEMWRGAIGGPVMVALSEPWVLLSAGVTRHAGCCGASG